MTDFRQFLPEGGALYGFFMDMEGRGWFNTPNVDITPPVQGCTASEYDELVSEAKRRFAQR